MKKLLPVSPRLSASRHCAATFVSLALLATLSPPARAQELEPRTYANTATGVNLVGANLGFSRGNILLDPALPIEDLEGDVSYGILRYMRSFGLFERSAKLKLLVPFTTGDWDGTFEDQPAQRSASGAGDARVTLEWNFYGAPAMTAKELQNFEQKTIVGASIRVIAPTGEYDSTKLINLGSNRWSYRLEIGASRAFGAWSVEGMANVWSFGNNDDFLQGNYLQQDELWVVKTHLVYAFRPGLWVGMGVGYGSGGRTTINGFPRDNRQKNWRIGATVAYPINKQHGISLTIGSGFNQGAGGDFDTIAVGYQYAWGGL
jgi:hypothetical protein